MIRQGLQRQLLGSRACSNCLERLYAGTAGSRVRLDGQQATGGLRAFGKASSRMSDDKRDSQASFSNKCRPRLQRGPQTLQPEARSRTQRHGSSGRRFHQEAPPPPRPDSTGLFSAVLLGPIYISLALLSGEGLEDRQGEANQWADLISDIVTPPSPEVSYSDAVDGNEAEDEGFGGGDDGNLLIGDGEEGEEDVRGAGAGRAGSKLERSQPSPAELWRAHMQRFFSLGVHHLGVYFRTSEVADHGPLSLSGDAGAWYGPNITSKLISVEDDVPPAAQNHDRDSGNNSSGSATGKGRFVLAQLSFHDVGTDEYHDPHTIQGREEFRPGKCAGAVLDDLERRLHQLGASRALLLTLDEDTYHTVYWDGRRFVTVLFLEFTPLPGS